MFKLYIYIEYNDKIQLVCATRLISYGFWQIYNDISDIKVLDVLYTPANITWGAPACESLGSY